MIRGTIPPQIDGTFYRVMPDTVWAPRCEDDIFINGDGAIDAVRIRDGHADFKQRYVRSEKFLLERAARKALFGQWRNIWTDDPRVRHIDHATGNTHVVLYDKQLLAMKEDGLPYAMDPDTLETKGERRRPNSRMPLREVLGDVISFIIVRRRLRFQRSIQMSYAYSPSQDRPLHRRVDHDGLRS